MACGGRSYLNPEIVNERLGFSDNLIRSAGEAGFLTVARNNSVERRSMSTAMSQVFQRWMDNREQLYLEVS